MDNTVAVYKATTDTNKATKEIPVINSLMFSIFPEKIIKVMEKFGKKNIVDLDINSIIRKSVLEELIKASNDRCNQKFIVFYNFALYTALQQIDVEDINIKNIDVGKKNEELRNKLNYRLDPIISKLKKIIPGYSKKTLKQKVDYVHDQLQIIFNRFLQILSNNGINNVEFTSLSSLDEEYALDLSRCFVADGTIDLAKHLILKHLSKIYPGYKIYVLDGDAINDYKAMESLEKSEFPISFTVADNNKNFDFAGTTRYVPSHRIMRCIGGEKASKILSNVIEVSTAMQNGYHVQYCEPKYDNEVLNFNGGAILSLAFCVLYHDKDFEDIIEQIQQCSGSINVELWINFCKKYGMMTMDKIGIPEDQIGGSTWCVGNNPADEKLFETVKFQTFIKKYIKLGEYLKDEWNLNLGPRQFQFVITEMLELSKITREK